MRINSIHSFLSSRNSVTQIQKNISCFDNYDSFEYSCPLSFAGVEGNGKVRQRGLLMHITSLPAHRSYCGQFGDSQTEKFIDWMVAAKQTHWIMNPLNALENHLCPYSAVGRFSRNKFIVNLNKLTGEEYGNILKPSELPDDITAPEFTLDMLERQKNPRFKIAFERFEKLDAQLPIKLEYNKFLSENDKLWLEDYANYDMLAKRFGSNWRDWPKELQSAPEDAKAENVSLNEKIVSILKKFDKNLDTQVIAKEIGQFKFEQFLYDKQFDEMAENLKKKGITVIVDLPIGVSSCGVDTWGKKNIFLLDKNYNPIRVSGCPPEKQYQYTQVWGHALYDYDSPEFWEYHEASLRKLLKNTDLRLDHFVGYINRAEIPTAYTKKDGTILNGVDNIFKPEKDGGMGVGFFSYDWVENISDKKNKNGENIFDVFVRVAKECGKKPEDCYVLEDFGPLAKTDAYMEFQKKYGKSFMSQRVPIGVGLKDANGSADKLNSPFNMNDANVAILTGNHDMASLMETLDGLMNIDNKKQTRINAKRTKLFQKFCKTELRLTADEMKNKDIVYENLIRWFYTRNAKQVQTTLQDALGIYWRPNIPGFWHGTKEKFLQKPTPEGLLPFWNKVFPKDFLNRDNQSGINPGYKKAADNFVQMMKKLYPDN